MRARIAFLASVFACSCVLEGGEDPVQGTTSDGEGAMDGPAVVGEREPEDLPRPSCEPRPQGSCEDARAPDVLPLRAGERIGVSTRGGIDELVFGDAGLRRAAPSLRHPAYLFLLGLSSPEISASLSASTREQLEGLLAAAPEDPGPYSDYADATVRFADRQLCFAPGCGSLDALVDFATAIDQQLLEAWGEQDTGVLYAFEEITIQSWPLRWDWGDGGHFEVEQDVWDAVEVGWYEDEAGGTAYIGRYCTGTQAGCNVWKLDVEPASVEDSPLSEEQHRALLGSSWGSLTLLELGGEPFDRVRDADALALRDPDDPETTRWVAVLAVADPVLEVEL